VSTRVTDGAHISPDTNGGAFDFVSTRDLKDGAIDFAGSLKTSPDTYEYMVRTGCKPWRDDLLFSKDGTVGTTALVDDEHDFVVASSLIIVSPNHRRILPRFLLHAFSARPVIEQARTMTRGAGLPRLSVGNLARIEIPLPPLDEQRIIIDFLDRETAQIDALVAKQEEFIGFLRERRGAAVSAILSRVEPTEHLPDKLHRRTRMGNGSTPRSDEDRYWLGGDIPWVNSSVVNQLEVREPSRHVTEAAVRECHLPMVRQGSILVALTGQGKTRGTATMLRIDSTINQHLAFIEPDERFWVPEYLLWLLHSNYEHLRRISSENGATKGGLTVGDLRALRLAMPPLTEQHQLLAEVEATAAQIDALIAKTEEHIALAKERRAALITAAVTGQFDVRTVRKAG
jgi:type I restriction enzyme S subunit